MQSDIAQRIASSMEAVLSPAEKASLEEVLTTNTEAYNYYLQGNYYWDNYVDSAGNAKAAELYEKAAELDPSFARAFAMAAVANHGVYNLWDFTPARRSRFSSALDRARAIKPDDPVVHWAVGSCLEDFSGREPVSYRKQALDEFQKALESRPNWAELHKDIGAVLIDEGALPEARESFRRWSALSPMTISGWGWDPFTVSMRLREWDVARKEVDEYIARRPDDQYGYLSKADILINGYGDLEGARAVLQEGMRLPPNQYRAGFLITANHFWQVNYLERNYQDALACLVEPSGENVYESWYHWLQKGITYVALNQRVSAMACFDSALSFSGRLPTGHWNHYQTGIALAWLGDTAKAALEFTKAESHDLTWGQRHRVVEAQALSAVLSGVIFPVYIGHEVKLHGVG